MMRCAAAATSMHPFTSVALLGMHSFPFFHISLPHGSMMRPQPCPPSAPLVFGARFWPRRHPYRFAASPGPAFAAHRSVSRLRTAKGHDARAPQGATVWPVPHWHWSASAPRQHWGACTGGRKDRPPLKLRRCPALPSASALSAPPRGALPSTGQGAVLASAGQRWVRPQMCDRCIQ